MLVGGIIDMESADLLGAGNADAGDLSAHLAHRSVRLTYADSDGLEPLAAS
jgi:hypothetical protein